MEATNVIKFPKEKTKRKRRVRSKKPSKVGEVLIISMGVVIGDILFDLVKFLFFKLIH